MGRSEQMEWAGLGRSRYHPALGPGPRGRALAEQIQADVRRGRLVPGERLPGARLLARRLGLARGTVDEVYRELVAEGWLERAEGSGTFVRGELPTAMPEAVGGAPAMGFDLDVGQPSRRDLTPRGTEYALLGGRPDLRLLPLDELARAVRRVLRGRGRRLVDYGSPAGTERLKEALSDWLAETRSVRPVPGGLLVTRGSQQGLYLLGQALLRPGDRVAVESMGYPPAWEALAAAGAELVPVAVDDEGARVDELPDGLRAVYLTPHHQYPTGATLSAGRRLRLLRWAAERRVVVIEDDYDHEYHYEGTPVTPLVAADRAGVVVSLGTLSKAFAPGLRMGWVVAPPPLIARLVQLRSMVDRQGDQVMEHAVAELLRDGVLSRHLRRTRRVYGRRRQVLLEAVRQALPEVEAVLRPGGLALWCRVEQSAEAVEAWAERCRAAGVHFETALAYTLDGSARPFVRLGFAGHDEGELREAVRRMATVW